MPYRAIYANVRGRVQGVFFRAFTRDRAKSLGLKGYVRNLPDGSVEVYAEGDEGKLRELIDFLHEGSSYSSVEDVDVQYVEPERRYEDFEIVY